VALGELTINELLKQLAAKTPTPGGGAVAGLTAALAASLARMVLNYSIGRAALAEFADDHREALVEMERLQAAALKLADEDAAAYSCLNALWKLDETDPKRRREWNNAVTAAIDVPMRLMQACLEIVHLQVRLVWGINSLLRSDWAIAAVLAHAAAESAMWNVRVNLPQLDNPDKSIHLETETAILLQRVEINRKEIEEACQREAPDG
jgi:formiminotetrahydrofolate cyclodeaminase